MESTFVPLPEVHIAGLLLQAQPAVMTTLAGTVAALAGAEVRGQDQSKLVVVYEAASAQEVVSFIDRLRELPGVLNVSLVYQHTESAADMEEMIDGSH